MVFDFAAMLRRYGYGDLAQITGTVTWPPGVLSAHRQAILASLMVSAVNRMPTQVVETLLAVPLLVSSQSSRPMDAQGFIVECPDQGSIHRVDLSHLTCTCQVYEGRMETGTGMCRHLILSMTRYGLGLNLHPADVLATARVFDDLLRLHPRLQRYFRSLNENARSAALAVATALAVGAKTGTFFDPAFAREYLLALDHSELARLVSPRGDGHYFFYGSIPHKCNVAALSCNCAAIGEATLCEGLLAVIMTTLEVY